MTQTKYCFYALRPQQWVKNSFVFLPLIFSHQFSHFSSCLRSFFAFLCFCGIASSVYIFNDMIDLSADAKHPKFENQSGVSHRMPWKQDILDFLKIFFKFRFAISPNKYT